MSSLQVGLCASVRLLIIACACAAPVAAADVHVAITGNDANSGSASAPVRSIQAGIDLAVAGDTVWIHAGTYRESFTVIRPGTATMPITIAAYGSDKPIIKGSQPVTGWTLHAGTTWKRTWAVNSQQVFANGVLLKQIGSPPVGYPTYFYRPIGSGVADMTPGSFHYSAGTLYVRLSDGSSPNDASMEASTLKRLANIASASAWVTFRGMSFRHSNSTVSSQIAAAIELGNYCRLENCDVQWMDGTGVTAGWARTGAQLIGSNLSYCGMLGATADRHANFTIRNCTISYNNQRGFDPTWAAGGIKVTTDAWGTIENCVLHHNQGPGIWFDFCTSGNPLIARGNQCFANWGKGAGLMSEGSKNVTMCNNLVYGNERRGIYISASDDVKVCNNTLVGNMGQAALEVGGMPREGKTLTNVTVRNNILSGNSALYDMFITKENGGDIRSISCDYNAVWRGGLPIANRWSADSRGGYAGTTATSLAAWITGSPFDDHAVSGDPRFVDTISYKLQTGSVAIDRGTALADVLSDIGGIRRPQGGAYDLGACEWTGLVAAPLPVVSTTPSLLNVRVNFQPASSSVPTGYIPDSGGTYAARNGRTYGWSAAIAEKRDRGVHPDQRYDTFIYTQLGGNKNWEMAVPNGTYRVRVVLGDPNYQDSYYKMAVEGVVAVSAAPTAASRIREGTVTVTVADGRLTLSNPAGASNNKLDFVEIAQQ